MPSKPVWLIVDAHGRAFVSCAVTRRMAISYYVNMFDETCFEQQRSAALGLSADQRIAWARYRKSGHRAVKGTLTWENADAEG